MKLFYPKSHYDANSRAYLFPLLRAIPKEKILSDSDGDMLVSVSNEKFVFTNSIKNANVIVLTMSWNYYVHHRKVNEAMKFINKVNNVKKKIWLAIVDDVGFLIPELPNTTIYRYSGYRSKLPQNHKGLPVFIPDPMPNKIDNHLEFPKYKNKPLVGFCGLASENIFLKLTQPIKVLIKNIAYYLNYCNYTPNSIIAIQNLRYQALKRMFNSEKIETQFLIRNKYRAGAKSQTEREKTKQEFYNNIKNSQYVLCMRGAGNFSARLYETLAMGRIPVYIHSDDLLPFEDEIDWKRHVVWVNWHERRNIAAKLVEFHIVHGAKSLSTLSLKNRLLWENYLQMGTFFMRELNSINK